MFKTLGITCMDRNTGPFSLELDYIGLVFDPTEKDTTEYESYYVPEAKYKTY